MKILVENSTWSNVGDGWYQYSLYGLFKQIFPGENVLLGEGPIKRAFRINKKRHLENSFELMQYEKADIHVFSGPIIPTILEVYKKKIIEIKNRGAQYVLISASGTNLSESKVIEIGDFFKKYPPLFFSSRDEETYRNFSPYINNSYNGICTAFIIDKVLDIDTFKMDKPFFISSFYTELDPVYTLKSGMPMNIESLELERKKNYLGIPYRISRHLNYLRPQQREVGDYYILRTIQNLNTRFNHINFSHPNSFISFNPLSYFKVAKSSEFVISDRVHACAINLAFGKPARFLYDTPRAGIFDRLGFNYKTENRIIYPNLEKIDEEYMKMKDKIRESI